jgi:hypothetical protein
VAARRECRAVISVALALTAVGCAVPLPSRVPLYIDPAFSSYGIESVALLPVVDRRVDRRVDFDLEGQVRSRARRMLERRRYAVVMPASFGDGRPLAMDEVSEMNTSELVALGPATNRFLMIVYVEDVRSSYVVMANTFKIELSATLLDKEKTAVLWRHKCVVTGGQAGLISAGLSYLTTPGENTSKCLEFMLDTLPKRPAGPK